MKVKLLVGSMGKIDPENLQKMRTYLSHKPTKKLTEFTYVKELVVRNRDFIAMQKR
jgi:hypothetical protein